MTNGISKKVVRSTNSRQKRPLKMQGHVALAHFNFRHLKMYGKHGNELEETCNGSRARGNLQRLTRELSVIDIRAPAVLGYLDDLDRTLSAQTVPPSLHLPVASNYHGCIRPAAGFERTQKKRGRKKADQSEEFVRWNTDLDVDEMCRAWSERQEVTQARAPPKKKRRAEAFSQITSQGKQEYSEKGM
eukprot:ANDGO_00288.mRNA.1 hypothetical protein